jgi:hypothetical protein
MTDEPQGYFEEREHPRIKTLAKVTQPQDVGRIPQVIAYTYVGGTTGADVGRGKMYRCDQCAATIIVMDKPEPDEPNWLEYHSTWHRRLRLGLQS